MALLAGHTRTTTTAGDPLGRIAIPRIGSNFVFVSGTGLKSLKKGPGHYADTSAARGAGDRRDRGTPHDLCGAVSPSRQAPCR